MEGIAVHGPARDDGPFAFAGMAGREFPGEFDAVTYHFETDSAYPARHIVYGYACHVVALGKDRKVEGGV